MPAAAGAWLFLRRIGGRFSLGGWIGVPGYAGWGSVFAPVPACIRAGGVFSRQWHARSVALLAPARRALNLCLAALGGSAEKREPGFDLVFQAFQLRLFRVSHGPAYHRG